MSGETGRASFTAFYDAHYPGLVRQLYVVTGSRVEAEECAQEAFVRAWPRWSHLDRYDDPRAWVTTVAHRVAVSRWRRARTALRHLQTTRGPADVAGPDAATIALREAIRALPDGQRQAVVLHHLGGLTVAEIARAEGVAEGTVKARLSRGRTALAARLGEPPAQAPGAPPADPAPPTCRRLPTPHDVKEAPHA